MDQAAHNIDAKMGASQRFGWNLWVRLECPDQHAEMSISSGQNLWTLETESPD
jgi:hypothetical protein